MDQVSFLFMNLSLELETLNLKIETDGLDHRIFHAIELSSPNLRHITFDSCQSQILSDDFEPHFLQLKTIRLENCVIKNSGFIHALLGGLKDTAALEKIEVIGCKGFDEGAFEYWMEKEKLVWL